MIIFIANTVVRRLTPTVDAGGSTDRHTFALLVLLVVSDALAHSRRYALLAIFAVLANWLAMKRRNCFIAVVTLTFVGCNAVSVYALIFLVGKRKRAYWLTICGVDFSISRSALTDIGVLTRCVGRYASWLADWTAFTLGRVEIITGVAVALS